MRFSDLCVSAFLFLFLFSLTCGMFFDENGNGSSLIQWNEESFPLKKGEATSLKVVLTVNNIFKDQTIYMYYMNDEEPALVASISPYTKTSIQSRGNHIFRLSTSTLSLDGSKQQIYYQVDPFFSNQLVVLGPKGGCSSQRLPISDQIEQIHFSFEEILNTSILTFSDMQSALETIRTFAKAGNNEAQLNLGLLLSSGLFGDFGELPEALFRCAEYADITGAHMVFGLRHLYGLDGFHQDCPTAAFHYRIASQQVLAANSGLRRVYPSVWLHNKYSIWNPFELHDYHRVFVEETTTGAYSFQLGEYYLFGELGFPQDFKRALECFETATRFKVPRAFEKLGFMHWRGLGIAQNISAALQYFEVGAALGSPECHSHLGYLYLFSVNVDNRSHERNFTKALFHFSVASTKGVSDANFYLGEMNALGLGIQQNISKALEYYMMAAETDHPSSLDKAARIFYEQGKAGACKRAVGLWKRVAEGGRYLSGMEFAHQHFMAYAYEKSILYYIMNAEIGYANAQSNAAFVTNKYIDGVSENDRMNSVLRYHAMSAVQGIHEDKRVMGDYYYRAWRKSGNEDDLLLALSNYRNASRSGEALFNLGYLNQFGIGIERNTTAAFELYSKCSSTEPFAWAPAGIMILSLRLESFMNNGLRANFEDMLLAILLVSLTSILWWKYRHIGTMTI